METRPLGNTGCHVSAIGFGAWAIGGLGYGDQDRQAAMDAIDAYLHAGGRFIDTARGYGVSEILIGKRLASFGRSKEVFLASKSGTGHPPIVHTDLETSCFCLQREAVDLYYIHVPPEDPDKLDRLLDAYAHAKQQGHTRLIGVSCRRVDSAEDAEKAMAYVRDDRVDAIQINYSYAQTDGEPIIRAAAEAGKGVVARSNMLGGLLTGKYRPGHRFDDPANDGRAGIAPENLDELLGIVQDIERQLLHPPYETMAQLALAFALACPGISAIIPGARSPEQVRANLSVEPLGPMPEALRSQLAAAGEEIGRLRRG